MPCRINKARKWTARLVLEACVHPQASFITLTYDEENIPDGGTLVPRDLQLWLKRYRLLKPFRYFAVGEYGDLTWRPHYHVAMFGVGRSDALDIRRTWGKGLTDTGDLTIQSARYIAGYVTKKLTRSDDPRLSPGIHPEFARMSLRPGIGAPAIHGFAEAFSGKAGQQYIAATGDVPSMFKTGRNSLPLDRYVRDRLRTELGVTPVSYPEEARAKFKEMLRVYENSKTTETLTAFNRSKTQQKILQQITKQKIYSQRGKL